PGARPRNRALDPRKVATLPPPHPVLPSPKGNPMSHAVPRRRTAVLGLAFVATAALLAGCSATPAPTATLEPGEEASGTIVVSTFPFGVEEFQQAIVDPFEEATGITV